jgi:hypothetical protein
MSVEADPMLVRLKRLPVRLRLAHLAALLRHARQPNNPAPAASRGEGSVASDNLARQGRAG